MQVRLRGVIGLAVLALLVLGACGGGSEPLTTQEYVDALAQVRADMAGEAEALEEQADRDDVAVPYADVIGELEELTSSLKAEEALSETDRQAASQLVDTIIEESTVAAEGLLDLLGNLRDSLSRLRPPEHLLEFHNAMVSDLEIGIQAAKEELETFLADAKEDLVTDTTTPQDLRAFGILAIFLPTIVFGIATEEFDESCSQLTAQLEAELASPVEFCN